MTASTRRELRSAATSTSTTAIGLIRALTDARPIKPTSTRCLSARRPNPAEAPLIDAEILFRQPQPPHLTRTRRRNALLPVAIAGIDYIVYRFIFTFGITLVAPIATSISDWDWGVLLSLGISSIGSNLI